MQTFKDSRSSRGFHTKRGSSNKYRLPCGSLLSVEWECTKHGIGRGQIFSQKLSGIIVLTWITFALTRLQTLHLFKTSLPFFIFSYKRRPKLNEFYLIVEKQQPKSKESIINKIKAKSKRKRFDQRVKGKKKKPKQCTILAFRIKTRLDMVSTTKGIYYFSK